MEKSRTTYVAKNAFVGMICQVAGLIAGFISRTIFVKLMGAEYLGVNGLYTNVLSILSFAELGIGQAITYSLYRPIATNDIEKIKSLMKLYKNAYRIIALVISVIGCAIIPFLKYIIGEAPTISDNLIVIYLLFLAGTVSSYLFVYKSSLISASQKNYKVVVYIQCFQIIRIILQSVLLIITHNYIVFLTTQIVTNISCNIFIALKADKMYPYLREKAETLPKNEKKAIFTNVRALVLYKLGSVILNGTDNVLISALVGVASVGTLSNYLLLSSSVDGIIGKITTAFTASIGNLNAISDKEKKYDIFKMLFFLCVWLNGFASVGLFVFANEVIEVWLGREYVLSSFVIFASVLHFYINTVHFAAYTYRTTLGFFVQGKIAPLLAAILNIVLSILFAKWWGMAGILLATSFARFFTTGIIDPVLIYKNTFKLNPFRYYIKYFMYMLTVAAIGVACIYINSKIIVNSILGLAIKITIFTIVFNILFIIVFGSSSEFKGLIKRFKVLISNRIK